MYFFTSKIPIQYIITMMAIVLYSSCNTEPQKAVRPEYRDVTTSVYASVTVQPTEIYRIYPKVGGILEQVNINEGQIVTKGDILARIESTQANLNVSKAKQNQQLTQKNVDRISISLQRIRDQIDAAMLRMRSDSINYMRQQRLYEKKIGSAIEYDQRRLAYESSQSQVQQLNAELSRMQSELNDQTSVAAKIAQVDLRASRSRAADAIIRAEISGMVYSVLKEQGELLSIQEPLGTIGSADDFVIKMDIDEIDITKVKVGQNILLTLDAYGDEVIDATVTMIYPTKNDRTQTFLVEAKFNDAPETLYPGLSGEANIIIGKKEKILTLPLEYISQDNMVQTIEGENIPVILGAKDMQYVEIISGVDTTMSVVVPNP